MSRRIWILLFFLPLIFPVLVAFGTDYNTHSDEASHLDAFFYYESHWLPPQAGSPEIYYDAYGESRLLTGELVYPLYGKIGRLLRPVFPPETHSYRELLLPSVIDIAFPASLPISGPTGGVDLVYYQQRMDFLARQSGAPNVRLYRSLNLLLLALTLALAARARFRWPPKAMFLVLLTLPSVIYLYAYANSDAFALSVSLLTTFFIFHIHESGGLTRRRAALLGLLLGLTWASKQNFWLAGLYNLGLLVILEGNLPNLRRRAAALGLAGLVSLLPVLPYRIILPRLAGNTPAAIRHAQELYARYGLKPSSPLLPRLALAQKGYTWADLLLEMDWLKVSLLRFYASFNYDGVTVAPAVAITAGLIFAAAAALTVRTLLHASNRRHQLLYIWSVLILLLNLAASLYRSLTYDFTPLGRYLFPSLIPLAFITFGGMAFSDDVRLRRAYRIGLTLLAFLHLIAWFTLRPA